MSASSHRYDLVVVGGGTAGLVAAVGTAGIGARVVLVERDRTGGDCLWTGCVPSKRLISVAGLAHRMRTADRLGLEPVTPQVDLARIMDGVRAAQAHIAPHDSPERLEREGVEVVRDHARFDGPGRVVTGAGRVLRYRAALVATGAAPVVPDVPGLAAADPLTSDTVWDLRRLPGRLLVVGGGPIGCELGQAFARLGSRVTLVQQDDRLLPREEPEAGDLVADRLRAEGADVHPGTRLVRVDPDGDSWTVHLSDGTAVGADRILVAAGRRATTAGLGLDTVGVQLTGRGTVRVDRTLRTTGRGIFAAGDVTGELPFTHAAGYQGGLVVTNAVLGLRRRTRYGAIPHVTFTDPEVARVGLTEAQARARWGDRVITASLGYDHVDRAVAAAETHGLAKLVADPSGRLVGATVAAPTGGEAIAELAALVARGAKLTALAQAVHAYPTFAEGPVKAASEHLRAQYLGERVQRFTRPVLRVLRAVVPAP